MADPMTLDQRLVTLAAMTDALPDPTVIVDRRSVVLHRNAAAGAEFPSMAPGSLLTLSLRNPALLTAIDVARKTGVPQAVELHQRIRLQHHDGRFAAQCAGKGGDPALVGVAAAGTARAVGATVAIGNVVGHQHGQARAAGGRVRIARHGGRDVAVPATEPACEGLVGDAAPVHHGDLFRGLRARAAPPDGHDAERGHAGKEGAAIDAPASPQLVGQHDAVLMEALRFAAHGTGSPSCVTTSPGGIIPPFPYRKGEGV